jgi:tetratricopeptide (TPR) repeat protein
MKVLGSLTRLFKKRPPPLAEEKRRWLEGYAAYVEGKKQYPDGDDEIALTLFDMAIDLGVKEVGLFSCRGGCLQALDYHLDAIDDFNSAIALDPEDANLYFQRAISKSGAGDIDGAISDIESAVVLSKIVSELNREYDRYQRQIGWPNGYTPFLTSQLELYKLHREVTQQNPELMHIIDKSKPKRVPLLGEHNLH